MLTESPDRVLSTSRATFSTNQPTGAGYLYASTIVKADNMQISVATDNCPFTDYFVAFYYAGFIAALLFVAIIPPLLKEQIKGKSKSIHHSSNTALCVFLQFHCQSHFQHRDKYLFATKQNSITSR